MSNVSNFPEAPNTNQGYLRKTTAGVGSWQLLANDTEYSTTKSQVQTNSGNITVIQNEQITQNTNISNLQTQVNNLVLNDLQDVDLTVNVPSNGAVLQYDSGLSQWISSLLPPSTNALSSLTDV